MEDKQLILDFIKDLKIAVISTVGSDNTPESAVLEFAETENVELIFDTFSTSRKYANLQINPHVSFVIGWDKAITVQYEGIAKEVKDKEAEEYKKVYFAKNPGARKWELRSDITYFVVTPTWIRYTDLNKDPWEIKEVKF